MLYEDGNGNLHDTSDLARLARRCAAVSVVAFACTATAAPPQMNGLGNAGGTPVSVENRDYTERKTDGPVMDMLARFVPVKVRVFLVGLRNHTKHTEQG